MSYIYIQQDTFIESAQPPDGARPFPEQAGTLLPPHISALHSSFQRWGQLGYAPGPVVPERLWMRPDHSLIVRCFRGETLTPYSPTSYARDLAAWLVLLDQWMETFVVIARARATWSAAELASALPFATPAYLPATLLVSGKDNWLSVAQALAATAADGPLKGRPEDRHWKEVATESA